MRVGVFENLGNNAYEQVKWFRRLGVEAELILDPRDTFVMSDPRWEDLDLELPTDQLDTSALPAYPQEPTWVRREPLSLGTGAKGRRVHLILRALRGPRALWWAARVGGRPGLEIAADRAWLIQALADYDVVFARGIGPIYCALAGVPCITQTYGGDITIVPFRDTGDYEGAENGQQKAATPQEASIARLQRWGLRRSSKILVADPRFQAFVDRLGLRHRSSFVPFVIDTDMYTDGSDAEIRSRFLPGGEGFLVFVPSRQDWYWKGSDLILRGFAAAAGGREDAHLACAGWGEDLDRSKELAQQLGIAEQVSFLPYAMSKVRLARYYRAADVVADQFTFGCYGTSALEAMSCERPVLIYLDEERYEHVFSTLPPFFNVQSADQIAASLLELIDPEVRASAGAAGRQWVLDHHGEQVARELISLASDTLT